MAQYAISDQFNALPPTAQRQVVDFIALLQARYRSVAESKAEQKISLADTGFIGMWRDREDMQDSAAWVRESRTVEWGEST